MKMNMIIGMNEWYDVGTRIEKRSNKILNDKVTFHL